jgi:hypothetical protein
VLRDSGDPDLAGASQEWLSSRIELEKIIAAVTDIDPDVQKAQREYEMKSANVSQLADAILKRDRAARQQMLAADSTSSTSNTTDDQNSTSDSSGPDGKTVHVNGYYREDGTYVNSYYRSPPGSGSGRR